MLSVPNFVNLKLHIADHWVWFVLHPSFFFPLFLLVVLNSFLWLASLCWHGFNNKVRQADQLETEYHLNLPSIYVYFSFCCSCLNCSLTSYIFVIFLSFILPFACIAMGKGRCKDCQVSVRNRRFHELSESAFCKIPKKCFSCSLKSVVILVLIIITCFVRKFLRWWIK